MPLHSNPDEQILDPQSRALGGTEFSWYRGVASGTGITVLTLLLSKPVDGTLLQQSLSNIQSLHPLLRSKLLCKNNKPFFSISPNPIRQYQTVDFDSTSEILRNLPNPEEGFSLPPFHRLLEHELNRNSWSETSEETPVDVFFVTLYNLADSKSLLALRLHTSVCDRTSAVAILREFLILVQDNGNGVDGGIGGENCEGFVAAGIEDLIPKGKRDKPFWAHGLDMLGYSLNSMRLANLQFEDVCLPRCSQVMRLKMTTDDTERFVTACRERGIKLCGALAAAGLIAAKSSKFSDRSENYAVVTLMDCRNTLDPPLHDHHLGFYHSAILNTHAVSDGDGLWDLATRCSNTLSNSMKSNKHFTDMGDVNFLMCKAIDHPGFTPSSSLRTSFIVVFEQPVIDDTGKLQREIGLEDFVGCSSVHGVGPSIAIFDTIRNGHLDCACVYPSPLHSRKQIHGLLEEMKKILLASM